MRGHSEYDPASRDGRTASWLGEPASPPWPTNLASSRSEFHGRGIVPPQTYRIGEAMQARVDG